ncbi:MAG: hypothetical protein K8H88_11285 [Sandaracinaceae bacterium]|nr:hypothetical protein [Sandaracinaceae bacterium]
MRRSLLSLGLVWLVGCGEGAMPPPADFDVNVNGFSFQNYTNDSAGMVTNLTPADLHRMFGDAVCASGSGPACSLTPPAREFMEQLSNGMNGGHCEGMAVLSLRMYLNQQSPMMFGGSTTHMLSLAGNEALQREIGYWFTLQAVEPVRSARIPGTPMEQVDRLRASFMGNGERYTIGFFKSDMTGGHAVTPYAVREEGGMIQIVVYDNNFPSMERVIQVDPNANTWQYEAAANPGNPASLYTGDASRPTLLLIPMSVRTQPLVCPMCGNIQMNSTRTVATVGDANTLITDDMGRRLGHMGDTLVEEIPGAQVIPLVSDDLWNDESEPLYQVPAGGDLSIELSADDTSAPASLSSSGAGYYLGVENVQLEPGQVDTVVLSGAVPGIQYETAGMETADIVLAITTEAADWAIVLRSRGDSAGQLIFAELSLADGLLHFGFEGADSASEFDMELVRVDGATDLEFSHANIPVPNGAQLRLDYGAFDTDGEMLVLSIDVDGDGMPDDSVDLIDEP